ncbi:MULTISPECIES: hypothetical protein [Treponema]|uniref:WD40 repeat domain-containing protein n=1 Tax=Treponema saccharophilum DSM 2985 TaxID=907348 RepID=H7EMB2_9SPIR|nr:MULTISPECIES: hypothetical protein [Treponema]EIC01197.1 hypothetical protein TresaDRAFT_0334 [Treponema saccharophilum DSM 2985]MBQ5537162.1 hypothetical protein [Treponema sp.]BDC95951.1 hypothetical protein TRSA_10500 [Treponema saccharophilum]
MFGNNPFVRFGAAACLGFFFGAFASARESGQAHQKSVSVVSGNQSGSVFSAGEDGFLIKWLPDDMGEHYQVSELAVKKIAQHPNGNDIAVYETDGASYNRVCIWDWKNQRRKNIFRFNDPITSLSYSAKGTYLVCSTTAMGGAYFINSSTGRIEKKLKETSAAFTFAQTGDSEKKIVMYLPTGTIAYHDLHSGELVGKFDTEPALEDVCMFGSSRFLAGRKGRTVFVIHAMTGRTLGTFNAGGAVLIGSNSSDSLFYISNESRQFKLFEVKSENGKSVGNPELLRTFSGIRDRDSVVSAAMSGESIYAGTKSGNVYKFDYIQAERVDVLQPITDDSFDTVLDISPCGDNFYILSPSSIHKAFYNDGYIDRLCGNPGYSDMIAYGDDIILWTKDSRKPVVRINPASGETSQIFTPGGALQNLRVWGETLLSVESNSTVARVDIATGKRSVIYEGAGIQDAVACNETDLYIAKSSATKPNVPLLYVNIGTRETVPLPLDGTFAYALNFDDANSRNEIYGIVISTQGGKQTTSIFAYDTERKSARTFFPTQDEDIGAFMNLTWPNLYTNVGKSDARSYNLKTKRDFKYKRDESMPLKVVRNGKRVAVLNRNGSISWYNADLANIISNWYLSSDGQWNEL